MALTKKALKRFGGYLVVGGSTFAADLLLLFFLTSVLHWNYLLSTAIAFVLAVSVNYVFSRKHIFKHTSRGVFSGYVSFLLIAGVGLALVLLGMYIAVGIYAFNYLISRIFVAGFVGMWNYLINLYVNFAVAGKHFDIDSRP